MMTTLALLAAPIWQLYADLPSYGSVDVHGTSPTEQAAGFRFTVTARPDGSLPLVRSNAGGALPNGNGNIVLYRKLPTGSYALYCHWMDIHDEGDGLLLNPGEYLYQTGANEPKVHGAVLLGGEWMPTSSQATYLMGTTGDSAYTSSMLVNGQAIRGMKFLVKQRADARMPCITQFVTASIHNQRVLGLYNRVTRTSHTIALRWEPSEAPVVQGAMLGQGEYLVNINSPRPAEYFQHAVFFAGHFK